jgi:hypothetical protein
MMEIAFWQIGKESARLMFVAMAGFEHEPPVPRHARLLQPINPNAPHGNHGGF